VDVVEPFHEEEIEAVEDDCRIYRSLAGISAVYDLSKVYNEATRIARR
jgi:hypothetical protein